MAGHPFFFEVRNEFYRDAQGWWESFKIFQLQFYLQILDQKVVVLIKIFFDW